MQYHCPVELKEGIQEKQETSCIRIRLLLTSNQKLQVGEGEGGEGVGGRGWGRSSGGVGRECGELGEREMGGRWGEGVGGGRWYRI